MSSGSESNRKGVRDALFQTENKRGQEVASEHLRALVSLLLPWFDRHKRDLPWRRDKTPYTTWISEIMLQQTRVEAVKGYYLRFVRALPTAADLAACPEDRLMKLWEGLGYYSRVRNLQKAARIVVERYGGQLPADYAALRALPGIGDYTAGAIASIAFGLPVPAVDGNVLRVIARYADDDGNIDDPAVRKRVAASLRAVYPAKRCGDLTESLMELGATVCLPNGAPLCADCPLRSHCLALRNGTVSDLPVRKEKPPRRIERHTVLWITDGQGVALIRRAARGVLGGQWAPPTTEGALSEAEVRKLLCEADCRILTLTPQPNYIHVFTHIEWHNTVYLAVVQAIPSQWRRVTADELQREVALPAAFPMPHALKNGAAGVLEGVSKSENV